MRKAVYHIFSTKITMLKSFKLYLRAYIVNYRKYLGYYLVLGRKNFYAQNGRFHSHLNVNSHFL